VDILDRILSHDAWTTRELLSQAEALPAEAMDRTFPIGHGTLRKTFSHMIGCMEGWTRILQKSLPGGPAPASDVRDDLPSLIERLDHVAAALAGTSRAIQAAGRLDERVHFDGEAFSLGAIIAHVITHGQHHRAQVLNMMRHLGVSPLIEGDVLTWELATCQN
jgi:uncharacterized damage-inducible protein DinB